MSTPSYNAALIDLAALRHNFRAIRQLVGPDLGIMAMVKADAYGHGLVPAARAFAQAGATCFGVAELEEGVRLRQAGIEGEIVVLLGVPAAGAAEVVEYRLTPVVFDRAVLPALGMAAAARQRRVAVQLKVDTGMGRLGIMPREIAALLAAIGEWPGLRLSGILSHFPTADGEDQAVALAPWPRFVELCEACVPSAAAGPGGKLLRHMANSAALLRFPVAHADLVRPGITLYGYYPAPAHGRFAAIDLQPAMSLRSRVVQVKEVPAGYGISYGHRFVTERPTRLAVLPVGYDDGYPRGLTGKAAVLIHGRRAPIRGTICMNACLAEVSEIPGVAAGDEVVLLGRQGEEMIDAEEIAGWLGTICYEILCLSGSRNGRVYLDSEAESGQQ